MKRNKLLFGLLLIFVFFISMGVSYSYFWIRESLNEETESIITSTGTLSVLFTDGPAISLLDINPGQSQSKVFTVKNTGSLDSYYKINWQNYNNTVLKDELVVSFTCTSYSTYLGVGNEGNVLSGTCDNLAEEAIYNRDLKNNIKLPVGYTHVYNLTIELLDINVIQNYNQGVTFGGVLQIEGDSPSWVESCEGNNSLRCKLITSNILEGENEIPADDVASTYVSSSFGINFASKNSPSNGQGLYRDKKYGDGENYYFRGGNYCAYTNYFTETTSGTACIAVGGTWTDYKCSLDFSESDCESKGFDYYRLNNNVSFAGYMWKIVRIDEDGNVRMMYNGTTTNAMGEAVANGNSPYNTRNDDNAFVGYMRPSLEAGEYTNTKEQAERNDEQSGIKAEIENWYRDYIFSQGSTITSKIEISSGFCNDRRVTTLDGGIGSNDTTYAGRTRYFETVAPIYKCSYESNDLFTVSTASHGNKKLNYPVAIMTMDELMYSGVKSGINNFTAYSHGGFWFWTLSPSTFSGGSVRATSLNGYGTFGNSSINSDLSLRTLISLNSSANVRTVNGGDGSLETPYVIE